MEPVRYARREGQADGSATIWAPLLSAICGGKARNWPGEAVGLPRMNSPPRTPRTQRALRAGKSQGDQPAIQRAKRAFVSFVSFVVPLQRLPAWVPAFAGMSGMRGSGTEEGALPELQALELARAAPFVDVLEIGEGAGGVADVVLRRVAHRLALVVVVAGGAVGGAHHAAHAGEQQLDPGVLGLLGHFDLLRAGVDRVADDRGDGLAGL